MKNFRHLMFSSLNLTFSDEIFRHQMCFFPISIDQVMNYFITNFCLQSDIVTKIIVTNFIFLLIFFTFTCHYINFFISNHIHKQIIHSFPTTFIKKSSIQSTKEIKNHCTFKTIELSCSQSNYNHLYINDVFSYFTKSYLSSSSATKTASLPPISYMHKYKEKYINIVSTRRSNYLYN